MTEKNPRIKAKAAIIDTDGTLIETTKRFCFVFNKLLRERGREPLGWEKFLERYIADTLDDLVAPSQEGGREEMLHEFWLEFLRRYRAVDVAEDQLIPGVKEVLADISGTGIPIAVITSCIVPSDQLREELARYGLSEFVDTVVTGDDAIYDLNKEHHFSKREIFRLAAEKLGVAPQDCVVVGDYWNDVRDGRAIGTKTVAVLTGLMRRELLMKAEPDAIIESIRDLPKVVTFEVSRP
ncbi:MAG: HAD family hydrolase [Candidatus Hadarchaeota archaeon]|nr:HAD family hydrolase [Candidatus Hadarchaeota archaeon]